MKKFKLLEDYRNQGKAKAELLAKYAEKEKAAGQRIQDLKAQLSAVISEEIKGGKDSSAKKKQIAAEISEAETEYSVVKQEREQANKIARQIADTISKDDVVKAYLDDYLPALREEELEPLISKMKEARSLYYNTIIDLLELEDKYYPLWRELKELGSYYAVSQVVEWGKLPKVTESELYWLQYSKKLPSDVKRKGEGK